MIYVGVDGGGSTCRVRLRDDYGTLLGAAAGAASNVYLRFDEAVETIRTTILAAIDTTGLDRSSTALRIGLGLAGVSSDEVGRRVHDALADLGAVQVTHDGAIACIGAHAGANGGLIIAGTGSGAVARIDGVTTSIGGRGFILGDDGSGARLGLDALRRALMAHDSLAEHTPLTRRLMARFDDDPVQAIAWGRAARSAEFAAFAPWVTAAADAGDPAGLALVRDAAGAIASLAGALRRLGAPRLSFVGGLSGALVPHLPDEVRGAMAPPLFDALDGALLMVGCPLARPATAPGP